VGEQGNPPQVQASVESDQIICNPDESSLSLVYCLRSHNMIGWWILFGLCNSMWLLDKLFLL